MGHRLTLDPMPVDTPGVLFDMTRLIRNVKRPFATGIDRIDLAIALDLASRFTGRCRFVHQMRGGIAYVPDDLAGALLTHLDARWHGAKTVRPVPGLRLRLLLARVKAARAATIPDPAETTYVVASHSGIYRRPGLIDRIDPSGQMPRLVYLHDLIPLEHPDYQTQLSVAVFRAWLAEAAKGPARFVVNSKDTGMRLSRHAAEQGWSMAQPVLRMPRLEVIAMTGTEPRRALASLFSSGRAVFIALGTLEPRKNHALLLEIWLEFARDRDDPPALLISGRRGWLNEEVFETLDWEEALEGHVHEFADLTDAEVAYAMMHARALVFPSFAEGLGIPAMEAAVHGLPVIASDLPALREIAADGTVFLSPNDKQAWTQAILSASHVQR